jgi:DNA-binding transcriptional regulator of glucitol operon
MKKVIVVRKYQDLERKELMMVGTMFETTPKRAKFLEGLALVKTLGDVKVETPAKPKRKPAKKSVKKTEKKPETK